MGAVQDQAPDATGATTFQGRASDDLTKDFNDNNGEYSNDGSEEPNDQPYTGREVSQECGFTTRRFRSMPISSIQEHDLTMPTLAP